MSFRRQGWLLIRYSVSPLRKARRVIMIWVYSEGSTPESLLMSKETSAMFRGGLSAVPLKMTSSILLERKALARCSPSTQRMASMMLDLPQPLGPTTEVMPSPGKLTSTLLAKDLNPKILSLLKYMNFLGARCRDLKAVERGEK